MGSHGALPTGNGVEHLGQAFPAAHTSTTPTAERQLGQRTRLTTRPRGDSRRVTRGQSTRRDPAFKRHANATQPSTPTAVPTGREARQIPRRNGRIDPEAHAPTFLYGARGSIRGKEHPPSVVQRATDRTPRPPGPRIKRILGRRRPFGRLLTAPGSPGSLSQSEVRFARTRVGRAHGESLTPER